MSKAVNAKIQILILLLAFIPAAIGFIRNPNTSPPLEFLLGFSEYIIGIPCGLVILGILTQSKHLQTVANISVLAVFLLVSQAWSIDLLNWILRSNTHSEKCIVYQIPSRTSQGRKIKIKTLDGNLNHRHVGRLLYSKIMIGDTVIQTTTLGKWYPETRISSKM